MHLHTLHSCSRGRTPCAQIDFPLSNMRCNGEECGGGQYEITYFAAVSRFNTDDQYISNPQYDRQVGNWITGSRLPTEAFPTSKIYIGEWAGCRVVGLQACRRPVVGQAAGLCACHRALCLPSGHPIPIIECACTLPLFQATHRPPRACKS